MGRDECARKIEDWGVLILADLGNRDFFFSFCFTESYICLFLVKSVLISQGERVRCFSCFLFPLNFGTLNSVGMLKLQRESINHVSKM